MPRLLDDGEHWSRPWRIHEIAGAFRLENVWAIPLPSAGPRDFKRVLDSLFPGHEGDHPFGDSPVVLRALLRVRRGSGRLLRWDRSGLGRAGVEGLLRDRLPDDLDRAGPEPRRTFATMTSAYELDTECAFEFVNTTVHGVMHLGWVRTSVGGYELRMAELTRPLGRLGLLYLAAIAPFRRRLAVPALLRHWTQRLAALHPVGGFLSGASVRGWRSGRSGPASSRRRARWGRAA